MGEASNDLSLRERRKREVRERIMAAAMKRFIRRGFDDTTVDEIAEDADVAQKTCFNYFSTKQELFHQLAEERIDELQDILEEERGGPGTTRRKLEHCFLRLSELLEERGLLARDLILESMRARPPGTTGDDITKLHRAFGAILRDGQARGDVRTDHPIEFLTEMVVGGFGAVMNNWVNIRNYPVKDRLAQTAAFLGEAISPAGARNASSRRGQT